MNQSELLDLILGRAGRLIKSTLVALCVFLSIYNGNAQTISPLYFSQNAWMPDTIGNASACIQPPCILWGQLHNKWPKIGESGAKTIRFGGIQVDKNMPTNYQYIKMIDSIRAQGMEPIMQVPFYNWRYNASQAAAIVNYINNVKGKNIKYWIIGNEPDHVYGYTTANQVASYIKPFATAMKAVDPSIKIIGPETAWFNTTIMNGLTNPGGPDDITGLDSNGRYYIDILSFHCYAFNGTQTRSAMLTKLLSPGGLDANLAYLNGRIATCNTSHGRTGATALKTAITEANVNWQNASTDNLNGTGVNSFIGGQFIAEMFGVGLKNSVDIVNMWSVVEGNNTALNIGYIDGNTGNKKPAYHHFQMMSEHFSGNYLTSASTQTNVKVYSCQNSSLTTVMVLNEDLLTNFSTTIRLNNATVSGTNALKINVNSNIAVEYNDIIGNQSTVLLQFDVQGNLLKKITYSLASHAVSNLPPTVTNYTPQVQVVVPPVNNTPLNNLSRCTGKTATLTASSGSNTITWYASATSTAVLSTGSVLITPSLSVLSSSATFVYYVQANNTFTYSTRTPITVTIHPRPVINLNSGSICAGNSFTISPSGAGSYTISGGSFIVSPLTSTAYYVNGTNSLGCTSTISAVANITVNPVPAITVNSGSICAGSSFVLVPSGASTYTYSNGSATVNPVVSTSYSVTGTSAQGCTSSNAAVAMVSVAALPVITANSGSICSGDVFTISPTGASSYSISGGSATVSPQSTSSYSITGDNGTCVSAMPVVVTVTVNALPVISVNSGSICSGASFVLTPAGAATYSFSSVSPTVNPSTNTSYSVTGTSAQGCLSSNAAVAMVSVVTLPVISASSGSICSGDIFTISPTGASSYTFSGGSATVSPLSTSSYSITGSNGSCISANPAVVTVTVNARPVISVNSGTICPGASFVLSPNGALNYTFSSSTATVNPSTDASYSVTGTSAQGCSSSNTAIAMVFVVSAPSLAVNSGSICAGNSFTLSPSGASSYTFSGGSAVVNPTVTTSYSVIGSIAGCPATGSAVATVTVNSRPIISVNGGSICAGSSFAFFPSGASSYTVLNGGLVVSPVTTTSYQVAGTNAFGCTSAVNAIAVVSVQALPLVAVNSGSICKGNSFTMLPTGAQTYTFSSGSAIVSPNSTTSYTVTGSLAGCNAQAVSVVTVLNGKNGKGCNSGNLVYSVAVPTVELVDQVIITKTNDTMYTDSSLSSIDSTAVKRDAIVVSTGEKMPDPETRVLVFPNPSNGLFTIEIDQDCFFVLANMDGLVVRSENLNAGKTQADISELPRGVYLGKFIVGEKILYSKIIKQ